MRLSDIMSNMDLTVYPQVALVIFLAVFAAVVWRVFHRRTASEFAAHASLPLDESPVVERTQAASTNARTNP